MVKVSIIIPIYNVEKYLEKCLSSCLGQTMQEIEVIAVNDASPDCSDVIMKKYAELYPEKLINIFLEENVKQGGARNIGIRKARGKYLCFVDGDDYIDDAMCEKLYEKCEREDLDIACCDGYRVCGEQKLYWEKIKVYDVKDKIHLQNFTGQCYMLIRKDIITNNELFYPQHIFHEDCSVVPLWYLKADRVGLLEEALYYQNMHADSCSSVIEFESTFHLMKAMDALLCNSERTGLYEKYKDKIDCFILSRIVIAAKRIMQVKEAISQIQMQRLESELSKWSRYCFDAALVPYFLSKGEYSQILLFLRDISTFMQQDYAEFRMKLIQDGYPDLVEKTRELIDIRRNSDQEIVVWGVGEKGRMFISSLKRTGISYVVGDNKETLWNRQIETDDVVRNLKWIKENMKNPVFLITPTRFYRGIVQELKKEISTVNAVDVFSYFIYADYFNGAKKEPLL